MRPRRSLAILGDEAGFTLVIQRHAAPVYPDGFHIGFIHDATAPVYSHRERLIAAGLECSPIDINNRGTRFYLRGPGELLIEVSTPCA